LLKFIRHELTSEQYSRVVASLSAAERRLIEQESKDVAQRVSEFTLNRLTVEAARAKGESVEDFGRRAGRAEFANAVGTYRFFIAVLTPNALLRKASSLWTDVHSHGSLTVEHESPSSARVRLANFPSEEAHCARLTGWFEGAGEMTRVNSPRVVHDVCLMKGDTECQWYLSWQS
jgi:hypothetical protein